MLKEYTKLLTRALIIFDGIIVILSFYIACFLANIPKEAFFSNETLWLTFILLLIWTLLLYYSGIYNSFRTKDTSEIFYQIFKSAFFGLLIYSGVIYFLMAQSLNRNLIALIFIIATCLLCLEKVLLISVMRSYRRKGYNYRIVLIVGTNRRAAHLVNMINAHSEWGLRIFGLIDDDERKAGEKVEGLKIVGSFKDMPAILHNNVIDEVIFVVPRSWLDKIQDLLYLCETEGIKSSVSVDFFDLKLAKAKQTDLHGLPLLTFETTPDKFWHLFVKRSIDILLSAIALVLLLPVFIAVSIMIKATSKGPVFFKQGRVTVNGRQFTLYKFRTMVAGAEDKLQELKQMNEMKGPVFKMKNDPRITPVGKFLRKSSIDELPQLWNVLKGDMSLVGPRPPVPEEVKQYDNWHRRRLSMRPGLTCLWQVSGRNTIVDFDKWAQLDLNYIDNWSLWLDFRIIFKTIPTVLLGVGAK